MSDSSLIVLTKNVGIKDSFSYEYISVQSLHRKICKLRTKEVVSVKVLWRNQIVEKANGEGVEDMKNKYLHLFEFKENANQITKFSSKHLI